MKTKGKKSREAAYKLLLTLCKDTPENVEILILHGMKKLMTIIPEVKKFAYHPNRDQRSAFGYAGITNLGCICYMNAMLQQFYMTPMFRYALLMADDKIAPKMVTTNKWGTVDDNTLH